SQTPLFIGRTSTKGTRNKGGKHSACQLVINIGSGTKIPGRSGAPNKFQSINIDQNQTDLRYIVGPSSIYLGEPFVDSIVLYKNEVDSEISADIEKMCSAWVQRVGGPNSEIKDLVSVLKYSLFDYSFNSYTTPKGISREKLSVGFTTLGRDDYENYAKFPASNCSEEVWKIVRILQANMQTWQ
ncbi:MAG: hypothetical protein AB7N80_07020, partial [Bdellovibrionales bacterium]